MESLYKGDAPYVDIAKLSLVTPNKRTVCKTTFM